MRPTALVAAALLLLAAGCTAPPTVPDDPRVPEPEAFWQHLAAHCGQAFPGRLVTAPPGDTMLDGTETLVVHVRQCDADTLRLPFHIGRADGWDRSRTWVFTRTLDGLELRHDHRRPDGTKDDVTDYGGTTRTAGTPYRQEFILAERTAADGSVLGWRVEVEPGVRYTYGTIRGAAWTWRVDFDLTSPVPPPPAPWGYERTEAHPPPAP